MHINPKYIHLQAYISSLPDRFDHEGRVIYHLRNVIKVFEAPDGTLLNVKRYHVPAMLNRLVYSIGLRKPKGERAWTYPTILLSAHIETPEPVAYIEERHWGLLGYSYFISVQCPYSHTLYEMADAEPAVYEPMARAVAQLAVKMHDNGILHKDFTPGNILFEGRGGEEPKEYDFSLVDINRMYFGKVGTRQGLLNLTKFWGPKAFTVELVKEYARLRNIPEQEALDIVLTARRHFWQRYLKRHQVPFHVEL